jgi:ribonucleoside-diphosphate reductase alpha chain
VAKFANMIFEPNGITDDPDVRIAQSLVDYLARRLAIDYLDAESRQALGIKTTTERIEEVNGSSAAATAAPQASPAANPVTPAAAVEPTRADTPPQGGTTEQPQGPSAAVVEDLPTVAPASPRREIAFTPGMSAVDAPFCSTCGVRMRPAGSCFVCESCGTTSGCS